MKRKDRVRFLVIRSIGNFLLLFALYGVAITFGPVITQEVRFRIDTAKGVEYVIPESASQANARQKNKKASTQPSLFESVINNNKERVLMPSDTVFSILIPKVGASTRIMPNVDPNNPEEFNRALLNGVAHAKGTVFPGYAGNTYLFAHSTDNWWNVSRYNAIFYLLKDLEPGDDIIIFFENRRYNYIVTEKGIADPTEVSFLVDSRTPHEQLILQTCWPPGTTWRRLFIIAEPKRDGS